jgi:putative transposase
MRDIANMLNAIHAQEAQQSAREKAKVAVQKLKGMKLKEAAQKIEGSIKQTITHMPFLADNRLRIRTKNGLNISCGRSGGALAWWGNFRIGTRR